MSTALPPEVYPPKAPQDVVLACYKEGCLRTFYHSKLPPILCQDPSLIGSPYLRKLILKFNGRLESYVLLTVLNSAKKRVQTYVPWVGIQTWFQQLPKSIRLDQDIGIPSDQEACSYLKNLNPTGPQFNAILSRVSLALSTPEAFGLCRQSQPLAFQLPQILSLRSAAHLVDLVKEESLLDEDQAQEWNGTSGAFPYRCFYMPSGEERKLCITLGHHTFASNRERIQPFPKGSEGAVNYALLLNLRNWTANLIVEKAYCGSKAQEIVLGSIESQRAVAAIKHPSILIYSYLIETSRNESIFLFSIGGRATLNQLPPEHCYPVIKGITGALAAVHKAGYGHFDLKPHNIITTPEYIPKQADAPNGGLLIDWTFVAPLGSPSLQQGTAYYLAPEACLSSEPSIPRNVGWDLWAWGLTIFEALTGDHPFDKILDKEVGELVALSKLMWNTIKDKKQGFLDQLFSTWKTEAPFWKILAYNLMRYNPEERASAEKCYQAINTFIEKKSFEFKNDEWYLPPS